MSDRAVPGPHLVVVGQMGVGKSTTGRAVADALGWPYSDSDDDLSRMTGMTGAEFAKRFGIEPLHQFEARVLSQALVKTKPHVVTAAASIVEDRLVREILPRRAFVAWLKLDVEETLKRQATGAHRRPMTAAELEGLSHKRQSSFTALQDCELDARRPTSELVDVIARRLGHPEVHGTGEWP